MSASGLPKRQVHLRFLSGCVVPLKLFITDTGGAQHVHFLHLYQHLEAIEAAIKFNDGANWAYTSRENQKLFSTVLDREALWTLYERCAIYLPAVYLAETMATFVLRGEVVDVDVRKFFAGAIRSARASRPFISEESDWSHHQIFADEMQRRWPCLQQLPARIWKLLGCEGTGGPTFTALLEHPPGLEAVRCVEAGGVGEPFFSPSAFFHPSPASASGRRLSASPAGLYRSLTPRFKMRPTSVSSPCLWSVLDVALKEHLETPDALHGLLLEFGVGKSATTLNMIARHAREVWRRGGESGPMPPVFGFDSFNGLPRAWKHMQKGAFDVKGSLPSTEVNAQLVIGYFNDTVGPFLKDREARRDSSVALVHLDADLYESTQHVLTLLLPWLRDGSVLVFDDMLDVSYAAGPRSKENWDAFYEILKSPLWKWTLEVVAAPYSLMHHSLERVCSAAAFRLHSRRNE